MRLSVLLVLASAGLFCNGGTLYQFSGTYTDFGSGQIQGPVTFSLSLPSPVTADTIFNPGAQLTCSDCNLVHYYAQGTYSPAYVTVGYGVQGTGSEYFFYFAPASYTQTGVYVSELLTGTNDGVLTTTISQAPGGELPEPRTWALMAGGLAVWGARRRLSQG